MGVWNKMTSVFFQEEEDDDEVMETEAKKEQEPQEKDVWQEPDLRKAKKTQIVSIPNHTMPKKSMEMVLVKAKSYDDMQSIAKNIKDRKVVIVNFEDMDKETAQRMVDFLSGAVFGLDGMPKKVSGSTFLFSSSQVDLEGQIMEDTSSAFAESTSSYNIWKR